MSQAGAGPVLVTGAAGFVGAAAVHALLARGGDVHVLLRDPDRAWRLAGAAGRLTIHSGDLRDPSSVRRCLAAARPNVVLHLATHGAYERQADASAILSTNILGTQNLLEASAEVGVELVVQTGSSSEYGFRDDPMRETDRLEPNSYYAVAKAAQTHLGRLWAQRLQLPVVCLRLFSIFGPWEEPTRLIPTLIRRAQAGLPLELADPQTARDFVYIDDLLQVLLDFSRLQGISGQVVNVGSGRQTTLRELVRELLAVVPSRSEIHWGAFPPRHWDAARWSADVAMAERLFDWRPRHDLKTGLARTAAWMKQRGYDDGPAQLRAAG